MLLDRRIFLKSIGVIGGGALVSCNTMAPEEKLSAYLTPPKEMVPGRAAYYATVCRACPAGCGILVKTREGRPIKLEGNPAHPVNRGRLCARGQAFVQELYSGARIQKPLLAAGGKQSVVSWGSALDAVADRLRDARSVGFLTGLTSSAFSAFLADTGRAFGAFHHVVLEPGVPTAAADAAHRLFGMREIPRIDLSEADYVFSLGADILDAFVSPVEFSRIYAYRHGAASGRTLEMDYAGPRRNLTAAAADRWIPVRASDATAAAGAVLKAVYEKKRGALGADAGRVGEWVAALSKSAPPASMNGQLEGAVGRLLAARNPLMITGGSEVTGADATALHTAVLLTDYLLGSVGKGLRFGEGYALSRVQPEKAASELIARAERDVDVLFVHGADPVYSLPDGAALSKAKFVVALSHSMDDTVAAAHAVLPVHHPLESWGDFDVTRHTAGLMQPVRTPLYNTRHAGDVLMTLRKRAGKPAKKKDYKDDLTSRWAERLVPPPLPAVRPPVEPADTGMDTDTDTSLDTDTAFVPPPPVPVLSESEWEEMLVQGGRFDRKKSAFAPRLSLLGTAPSAASAGGEGLSFVTVFSPLLYDGRGAGLEWLRETPDPMVQSAWDIPLELSADTAKSKGITDGDLVKLSGAGEEISVRVSVRDDMASGTAALPLGGGRQFIRHAEETGSPVRAVGVLYDKVSGVLVRSGVKVDLKRVSDGKLTSVMGSPFSEGRLLALSVSMTDLKADRMPIITRHGEVKPGDAHYEDAKTKAVPMPHEEKGGEKPSDNIYSLQEHKKHRWGLTVDLDKCTGCSACVTACYAENNVPVVGRDEVRRGRELSWIRIEKHILNTADAPRVQFLPVMCQQCDNAPCETVCPVFAASHTADGLNAQIYNRCVGTRYCANNCPYKVRRFNYFDYKRETPANQQLNPDVTVRSRGVMEKCTFCIQRIREVQNRKKLTGEPLRDGDIVPACVQTCPSGALSFGDFNEPKWEMSKIARDKRGYRLLDYQVNTRPGVVYLRKVLTVPDGAGGDE